MKLQVTVLGCGTSGGVPQVLSGFGACDPHEPKNRRLRSSLCLSAGSKRILVDTSPDLREQVLRQQIDHIDAVLYTHAHADHAHGIDDLRWFCARRNTPLLTYGDRKTLTLLKDRFGYAFVGSFLEKNKPIEAVTDRMLFGGMPVLRGYIVDPDESYAIEGLNVTFMEQDHGFSESLGIRIGKFAYSTDVVRLSEENFKALEGVEVWIVDCLGYQAHPTHMNVKEVQEAVERVKPKIAYLTHMNNGLDYRTLCNILPEHIRPAYDGLRLDIG